jgi:hypothetical protein
MRKKSIVVLVLYALAMVVVIVGVDLVFFRTFAWPRLLANIGIVLVFGAFYLRFLRP